MPATILVIDDDPSIVHLLKEDLEGEGYKVLEGYDGKAALEMAIATRPQLIVMDVHMPGIDGMMALESIRLNDATSQIPVLLLSGESSGPKTPTEFARVSHLTKPIELERLNSVVRTILS